MKNIIFSSLITIIFNFASQTFAIEILLDNVSELKSKDEYLLFTVSGGGNYCLSKVERNKENMQFFSIRLKNGDAKGFAWCNETGKGLIFDSKEKGVIKFTFIPAPKIVDERQPIPPNASNTKSNASDIITEDIKTQAVDVEKEFDNKLNDVPALNDRCKIAYGIALDYLGKLHESKSISLRILKRDELFLSKCKEYSDEKSNLGSICSLIIILDEMNSKITNHAKKALESSVKANSAEEKLQNYFKDYGIDLLKERMNILLILNKFKDSYLYHLIYPVYISTYIDCYDFEKAKELLGNYEKEFPMCYTEKLRDEIKKCEMSGDKGQKVIAEMNAKDFHLKEITAGNKAVKDERDKLFESKINEIIKNKEISPSVVSEIIKIAMVVMVKYKDISSPLQYTSYILPDNDDNTERLLIYEQGLCKYYTEERQFIDEIKNFRYCYLYEANRHVPIKVYLQSLKNNSKTGVYLYEYYNKSSKEENNIFSYLKGKHDSYYNNIIGILEKRYGQLRK